MYLWYVIIFCKKKWFWDLKSDSFEIVVVYRYDVKVNLYDLRLKLILYWGKFN